MPMLWACLTGIRARPAACRTPILPAAHRHTVCRSHSPKWRPAFTGSIARIETDAGVVWH